MTDLAALLARPEGRTLELKRDLSSLKPVLRTLVAFANTAGGTLMVGLADAGSLVGLADAKTDEERLASAVSEGIRPLLMPDIEVVHHAGVDLLVARVPRVPGPFYLTRDGAERGVFVRVGSTNRRADAAKLEELRRAARLLAFDELPAVEAGLDDLDMDLLRSSFAEVERELDDDKLESLGILVRSSGARMVSNGGVILFGKQAVRQRLFPDARMRCARFVGPHGADFLDSIDIDASLLPAIDQVHGFVRRNTRLSSRIRGMRREDIPEYPTLALREALVNAVAHADYSQRGTPISIRVFNDRLEVQSPGSLPFGLTLDDLLAGVSRIRNPVIARVLRELELMEQWGSGYQRIQGDCARQGHPMPEWHELGTVMRVVFRPHPLAAVTEAGADVTEDVTEAGADVTEDVTETAADVTEHVTEQDAGPIDRATADERQEWFVEQLAAGTKLRAPDLAERFGVSLRTAKRDIAALKANGRVTFQGVGRGGRYRLLDDDEGAR